MLVLASAPRLGDWSEIASAYLVGMIIDPLAMIETEIRASSPCYTKGTGMGQRICALPSGRSILEIPTLEQRRT